MSVDSVSSPSHKTRNRGSVCPFNIKKNEKQKAQHLLFAIKFQDFCQVRHIKMISNDCNMQTMDLILAPSQMTVFRECCITQVSHNIALSTTKYSTLQYFVMRCRLQCEMVGLYDLSLLIQAVHTAV